MARPIKEGLDYFTLDCCMNDKIKLIEAEFGIKGFAIIVKLYQKIYMERGYYCEWNDDIALLFIANMGGNSGVSKNLIDIIISASIRRGIFSKQLYDQFGILTSRRIQEQYFEAVSRRERVKVKKEYLLVEVGKNFVSVDNNSINVNRNEENVSNNSQSREEKSKEDNNVHSGEMHDTESLDDFYESIWDLYPLKKGKGKVSKTKKQVLQRIGYEQIKRCVERYVSDINFTGKQKYMMHGSTFFNSGYVDYLDQNYTDSYQLKKQKCELTEDDEELVGDDW